MITIINYGDTNSQLKDSEPAIGTSTRMLLCGEVVGHTSGSSFLSVSQDIP